ncbi:TPA: precorrin-2 C(20)-methyltransferase [Candidatus Poribacteria bacterium]|nr:precorrin-2 C(20)-methyltransferase [Candidatus Poribacteria bacterium]
MTNTPKFGRLYGIGVGPGDVDLLTVKAYRLLQNVPVIGVPKRNARAQSYAYSIVKGLTRPNQEILELIFPMTKDVDLLQSHWESAADAIFQRLLLGKDVAFITEGDPFLYSTFTYLFNLFREKYPDVSIDVVPGISSINGAAASAMLPLVYGDRQLAITPATCGIQKLRDTLEGFDTVVLLKVNSVFDDVFELLDELNLVDKSVFVSRCTSPDEMIVHDIRKLRGRKLDYLSLLIIRK